MKKTKHILLNINEDEFNRLEWFAHKEKRTITNTLYLLFLKGLEVESLRVNEQLNQDIELRYTQFM